MFKFPVYIYKILALCVFRMSVKLYKEPLYLSYYLDCHFGIQKVYLPICTVFLDVYTAYLTK